MDGRLCFTDNLRRRVVGELIRQPRSGQARAQLRRALKCGARVQVLIATPEPCQWNGPKVYTGLEAGLIEQGWPACWPLVACNGWIAKDPPLLGVQEERLLGRV